MLLGINATNFTEHLTLITENPGTSFTALVTLVAFATFIERASRVPPPQKRPLVFIPLDQLPEGRYAIQPNGTLKSTKHTDPSVVAENNTLTITLPPDSTDRIKDTADKAMHAWEKQFGPTHTFSYTKSASENTETIIVTAASDGNDDVKAMKAYRFLGGKAEEDPIQEDSGSFVLKGDTLLPQGTFCIKREGATSGYSAALDVTSNQATKIISQEDSLTIEVRPGASEEEENAAQFVIKRWIAPHQHKLRTPNSTETFVATGSKDDTGTYIFQIQVNKKGSLTKKERQDELRYLDFLELYRTKRPSYRGLSGRFSALRANAKIARKLHKNGLIEKEALQKIEVQLEKLENTYCTTHSIEIESTDTKLAISVQGELETMPVHLREQADRAIKAWRDQWVNWMEEEEKVASFTATEDKARGSFTIQAQENSGLSFSQQAVELRYLKNIKLFKIPDKQKAASPRKATRGASLPVGGKARTRAGAVGQPSTLA